jgi:hypothetical protein
MENQLIILEDNKMDNKEVTVLIVLIIGLLSLLACLVGMDYWNANQVRVMYQQAYAKNQECRMASQKSGFTNSIERICGPIPKFEDYQK